jgi:hypothetical protein
MVQASWNVMTRAETRFRLSLRNGRVHLNRRGRQFSRLLAAAVCASAVVILDTPCSEVVWRVLATHSIRQFPLYFPSRASPCAITFQLKSTRGSLIATVLFMYPWPPHKANRFLICYSMIYERISISFFYTTYKNTNVANERAGHKS